VTEEGLTQRDYVISQSLREANAEAEEGKNRLMQSNIEARRANAVG